MQNCEFDFVHAWMHEAADAIEDLIVALTASNEVIAKSKQQWIPVTERLPDVWKHVITFDEDDGVRVNWRCGDNVSWSMGYHVTHWMPLPEPPEEDIPMEYFESGGK